MHVAYSYQWQLFPKWLYCTCRLNAINTTSSNYSGKRLCDLLVRLWLDLMRFFLHVNVGLNALVVLRLSSTYTPNLDFLTPTWFPIFWSVGPWKLTVWVFQKKQHWQGPIYAPDSVSGNGCRECFWEGSPLLLFHSCLKAIEAISI